MNGKTQLIGIIGWPISHSFSPAMHNAAAHALGLNWAYVPLPVRPEDVATAVAGIPALGLRGVNVTVPHKQAVIPHLHALGDGARAIGAVNTILVDTAGNGGPHEAHSASRIPHPFLLGYNTDWSGFLDDLHALDVVVHGRDCLILGAGGSARAVAYGLARQGGRVQVLARRAAQAADLVADLTPFVPDGTLRAGDLAALPTAVASTHAPLLVNSTPLGMTPRVDQSPWPDELPFPAGGFVYDLIYNPATTRFMQQAQAAGCAAANGLGMLLRQGARAFELWTGHTPDLDVMAAALKM